MVSHNNQQAQSKGQTANAGGFSGIDADNLHNIDNEKLLQNNAHFQEKIIHRSENCIIVAGQNKIKDSYDKKIARGYKCSNMEPYVPLGVPENVLPVVIGLKNKLEHSVEMSHETHSIIQNAQRGKKVMFSGVKPERTLRIMNKDILSNQIGAKSGDPFDKSEDENGKNKSKKLILRKRGQQKIDFGADRVDILEEGDSTSLMVRMKMIEEQFMSNPFIHEVQALSRKAKDQFLSKGPENANAEDENQKEDGDKTQSKSEYEQFNNQRLLTPRMKKLMNNKDAREVLQEEINESVLRLKQAKFGHSLYDIVPDHPSSFYLPDKSRYFPKEKNKTQSLASNTADQSNISIPKSNNQSQILKNQGQSHSNLSRFAQTQFQSQIVPAKNPIDISRMNNSALNNTEIVSSLFITEPASTAKQHIQINQVSNLEQNKRDNSSMRKAFMNQNISNIMRATGMTGTTTAIDTIHKNEVSHFGQFNNDISQFSNYGPPHGIHNQKRNLNGQMFNSHNQSINNQVFRQLGQTTLSSINDRFINKIHGGQDQSLFKKNVIESKSVAPFKNQSTFNQNEAFNQRMLQQMYQQKGPNFNMNSTMPKNSNLSFRQAWMKAIEKYSPKRPMRLNDVSFRFQEKIDEARAIMAKKTIQGEYEPRAHSQQVTSIGGQGLSADDEEIIKFISMIDQKPIKPTYLDLIPLKNFAKKEQEAQRLQFKSDSQKNPETNDPKQKINFSLRKLDTVKMSINDAMSKRLQQQEEIIIRRQNELEQNIKLKKKQLLQQNQVLTAEEIQQIEKEEHQFIYSLSSTTLKEVLNELQQSKLNKNQEQLLRKLTNLQDTLWNYDSESVGYQLYKLFFDWHEANKNFKNSKGLKSEKQQTEQGEGKDAKESIDGGDNQKEQANIEIEDKEEKKKRQQFKLSQEMQEFIDNGGFPKVLNDIFNPTDQASMELDSVYQLKQLCKAFYEKKEKLSKQLVQCLDALANERPWTVKMKKKHFDTSSNNLLTDLEYMRINAERERIKKYQEITKDSAYKYYKILKNLSDYLQKQAKEEVNTLKKNDEDPQYKIKMAIKEARLKNLLAYITDFIKQVVENGNQFKKTHFFMLLSNLQSDEIQEPTISQTIKIIKDEMEVTEFEYVQFVSGLKDASQQKAYSDIKNKLFLDD